MPKPSDVGGGGGGGAGEAAQERRVFVCIVRGINWLCVDCLEAMNQEELYWYSGWLHDRFDPHETAAPGRQALLARGSLSVDGGFLYGGTGGKR